MLWTKKYVGAFILTFQIITVINQYLPWMLDQLQFCSLSFTIIFWLIFLVTSSFFYLFFLSLRTWSTFFFLGTLSSIVGDQHMWISTCGTDMKNKCLWSASCTTVNWLPFLLPFFWHGFIFPRPTPLFWISAQALALKGIGLNPGSVIF